MDYRVVEPGQAVVAARRDIRAVMRREANKTFYFLEDPSRGRYFRLGAAEYEIFAAMDGTRTLAEIAAWTATKLGADAFTVEQVVALAGWLVEAGLANTAASVSTARLAGNDQRRAAEQYRRWNPWFLRIDCGRPDRWLQWCQPAANVLFRWEFFAAWCVVVLWACGLVIADWAAIVRAAPIDLGLKGALQLIAAWCFLKLIHETAHGLACRHFGGRVGSWGIALVMGMPSPFIEVSSVWRLADKRQRMIVSLAGIYVELLVAAGAVFLWSTTDDGIVRQMALAVATVAGVATIMFNLNPLMRFDGYFAFADWLETPNLATSARVAAGQFAKKYLLAVQEKTQTDGGDQRWLTVYGLAAWAWRWLVCFSLVLLALSRFGLLITTLLSVLPATYFLLQAGKGLRRLCVSLGGASIDYRRLAWTYGSAAAVIAVWITLFDPRRIELPAIVDYEPLTVVRTASPGFVAEVMVKDGDHVEAGQLLAILANPDLETELAQAGNLVEQSLGRSRVHRQANEVAKEQAEAVKRRGLETKRDELARRRKSLRIQAATSGRVISHGIDRLRGKWLEEGEQIALIGDEAAKEVIAAVAQSETQYFDVLEPLDVSVTLRGTGGSFPAARVRLDPRAQSALIHPALSVENGGTMPVVRRERPDETTEKTSLETEHVEPHLRLHAHLDSATAASVHAGRTAIVSVQVTWGGLLARQWNRFSRRLEESLQ